MVGRIGRIWGRWQEGMTVDSNGTPGFLEHRRELGNVVGRFVKVFNKLC